MVIDLGVKTLGSLLRTTRHKLAGTVTVDGQPASRLVAVLDRRDLSWVAGTISDPATGHWELNGVCEYPVNTLIALALDNTATYNAEVADYLSQVATV
jgi:hypothetical protein